MKYFIDASILRYPKPCPSCGVKPGQPCLSIESKRSALASEFVGRLYRNETDVHEARK